MHCSCRDLAWGPAAFTVGVASPQGIAAHELLNTSELVTSMKTISLLIQKKKMYISKCPPYL